MIRNVVIHIANEQPLVADLFRAPESTDQGLICTNLRTLSGSRPVFIDDSAATFFFPYRFIRFLEIPAGATEAGVTGSEAGAAPAPEEEDADLDLDEEFLRRIREA